MIIRIYIYYKQLIYDFFKQQYWGLGIGDWGLGPIPNPQSPIPNPQSPSPYNIYINFYKKLNSLIKLNKHYKSI